MPAKGVAWMARTAVGARVSGTGPAPLPFRISTRIGYRNFTAANATSSTSAAIALRRADRPRALGALAGLMPFIRPELALFAGALLFTGGTGKLGAAHSPR